MRRRYTAQQKMAAVAEAELNGFAQASDKFGIPESNIRYWWDQPRFADLRAKTREDRVDGYRVLIHRAQQRLDERIDDMEPKDLINLMGVSQDKELLLTGGATSRTETVSITDDLPADAKRALRERLARSVRGESVVDGTGSDPVGAGERVDSATAPGAAD